MQALTLSRLAGNCGGAKPNSGIALMRIDAAG